MRLLTQVLLTFLLNAIWQVALIVAFAAFADWLLRGIVPRYRHALWIVTLLACITLPLFSVNALRKPVTVRNPVAAPIASGPVVLTRIITPDVEIADTPNAEALTLTDPAANRPLRSWNSLTLPGRVAFTILAIYIAFLLWKFVLLLRAWRRTQSIVAG